MNRKLLICLSLFAVTAVSAFAQSTPAGYISMPQGINCLGFETMQSGQEDKGWTLQSIGSLRCGAPGSDTSAYKEVALRSHDLIDGRIQTELFGTFVVMAQPAVTMTSEFSGGGIQESVDGKILPLSTDQRPTSYALNHGSTILQLAISQAEVQTFIEFLQPQGGQKPPASTTPSTAPATTVPASRSPSTGEAAPCAQAVQSYDLNPNFERELSVSGRVDLTVFDGAGSVCIIQNPGDKVRTWPAPIFRI